METIMLYLLNSPISGVQDLSVEWFTGEYEQWLKSNVFWNVQYAVNNMLMSWHKPSWCQSEMQLTFIPLKIERWYDIQASMLETLHVMLV